MHAVLGISSATGQKLAPAGPVWRPWTPEVAMSQNTDRDIFLASLALFDKDESELRQRALPADTDIDACVEAAFWKALGNPSILPL
jgi:hypothetical protein